jgi:N-ethylmaleimide reductase
VHEAGGHLFIQLMHVGRMSHPDNTPHHRQPVAPSAIAPGVGMHTATGNQPIPEPRALTVAEIATTVDDFRRAAAAAVAAGADGVEIHGANGYLLQQFLAPNANTRTDEYGGSIENRARLAVEVVRAVADEIGTSRTALRISPNGPLGGLDEGPDGPDLYRYLVGELAPLGLAYLNVFSFSPTDELLLDIRAAWPGPLLVIRAGRSVVGTPASDRVDLLSRDIESGLADIVPLGSAALANPDVVERLRSEAPLNEPDPATFYGGGAAGYIDYPTLTSFPGAGE